MTHDGEACAQERGGVLFYAGFDGTKDASWARGNGKAIERDGGGSLTGDGFGFIGSALRTGDGEGYVEYSAEGNINAEQGTIEFWMSAQDWEHKDGHFHRFIDVLGGGAISFHLFPDGVKHFLVRTADTSEPAHWQDTGPHSPELANRAYGCGPLQGKWTWHAVTWQKGRPLGLYTGGIKTSGESWIHNDSYAGGAKAPTPGKQTRILIGDFGGEPKRRAHTFIDELYIYDRALTREELSWSVENALTREPGTDVPADFMRPKAKVVPDSENKTLVVVIDSGDRDGNFAGTARLEPAMGTSPAPIVPTDGRNGEALLAYTDLPQGEYKVISDLTTAAGEPLASISVPLVVPGPPIWLGNSLGISETPPPPWPPIEDREHEVRVWGRRYEMAGFGLPAAVETQGHSLLASPISLVFYSEGKPVSWTGTSGEVSQKTASRVLRTGRAQSALGVMQWSCVAEFDGLVRYDLELQGAPGGCVDTIELRVPIRQEYATLYQMSEHARGALPVGDGVILQESGCEYWWIGNEAVGLCGVIETDEAWLTPDHPEGFRIERANGCVTVVYQFAAATVSLDGPWKMTWAFQATPVKPRPQDWRLYRADYWRLYRSSMANAGSGVPNANIDLDWPSEQMNYFAFPSPRDPEAFRKLADSLHERGLKFTPYSGLNFTADDLPEYVFFQKQWAHPYSLASLDGNWPRYLGVRLVPSWIDFIVWTNHQIIQNYGTDGIYVDFAGARFSTNASEHGIGYVRDGQERSGWPFFASRELFKRIYTMIKAANPQNLVIGHVSGAVHVPVLSFVDIWLDGEVNWRGQLKDNYLDVLPLDQLRAEWMCHQHGAIPWFLPEWHGAVLEDKDVAGRAAGGGPPCDEARVEYIPHQPPAGNPLPASVEKSHHLFGLGLLHDFGFWLNCGINVDAVEQYYGALDEFGIGDAEFFGYWDNANLIGGQTDQIKASTYRKPNGGALVVVYNTSRETKTPTLTIDWDQLKSDVALEVFDAYTKKPVALSGSSLSLGVPPLNYRLLCVK